MFWPVSLYKLFSLIIYLILQEIKPQIKIKEQGWQVCKNSFYVTKRLKTSHKLTHYKSDWMRPLLMSQNLYTFFDTLTTHYIRTVACSYVWVHGWEHLLSVNVRQRHLPLPFTVHSLIHLFFILCPSAKDWLDSLTKWEAHIMHTSDSPQRIIFWIPMIMQKVRRIPPDWHTALAGH